MSPPFRSSTEGGHVDVTDTIEQLLTLRSPADPQLSADGEQVAFVVAGFVKDRPGSPESRIWAGPTSGMARQISNGPGADSVPRFSPDGSRLAFASDRGHPGRAGLFLLEAGAEALPIGEVPGSIEEICWLPGGDAVVVLAADPGSDAAGIQGATEIGADGAADPEVRRPFNAWRRLYRVDLASGETTEVGPGGALTVWEFSLCGGVAVAVVSEDPTESGWYESWIASLDLDSREVTRLHGSEVQLQCPRISPDGRRLAWIEGYASDRGLLAGAVFVGGVEGGEARELAPGTDVTKLEWIDDASIRVCGPRGPQAFVGIVRVEGGELEELFRGPVRLGTKHQVNATTDAAASVFATVHEAPGVPPEVALLDAEDPASGWREVSALNGHLKELAVPEVEQIEWESDGLTIEGLLVRPAGAVGPLPTIVNIHGGPTVTWEWSFSPGTWNTTHVFTEAGYAVLLPNPRGSAGRGREFAQANQGDVGGGDFRDILAGVEACVERGLVLDDAVGAWGGSYGGFMSCWMVGNTDRFKAIVPVACHTNWLSFHNTANIPAFDRQFVNADPYEAAGGYFWRSPVVHAPKAVTPTLFLHGAIDKICPLGQAEEMYRALVETGVETELVIYAREGHTVIAERAHAVDAIDRLLGWMDRHVRGIERGA
jgi:dipeptidyl aminopeptidase/acylaminoacyl peptidase